MHARPDRLFDAEEILRVLTAHRVDFVVIGGIAVQAHGYIRGTHDLDIVPSPSADNLSCLKAALADLDGTSGKSGAYMTTFGPVDVLEWEHLAGAPRSYDALRDGALVVELNGIGVPIAGLSDLIRMKRAAGRDQDLMDIEALTREPEST